MSVPAGTMARRRFPLEAPRLVDDALEESRERLAAKRAADGPRVSLHVLEHFRLTVGLIDFQPERVFDLPDCERSVFARLRGLLESLNAGGHTLDTLSMGMSGDFEAAIAEGATLVRIGTALFGSR